jgi:hypothetical protein
VQTKKEQSLQRQRSRSLHACNKFEGQCRLRHAPHARFARNIGANPADRFSFVAVVRTRGRTPETARRLQQISLRTLPCTTKEYFDVVILTFFGLVVALAVTIALVGEI